MIGQVVYLRAVFWTNVVIGRLVFESLPRPFFDLIVFAGSVRRGSGGVVGGIGARGCGLNWGWHVFGLDWSMPMETLGLCRMCRAFL